MRIPRILCAVLIISATCAANVEARWMTFTGGPVVSVGTWPAGSALSGGAVATASNFVNGIGFTPFIGLTPITVNNLSPDYFATTLQPNPGPVVTGISTPYNDSGDKYHVVIDFTGTIGGSIPGTLPSGSIFAILDLDINENYRNISATNALNNPVLAPWIAGPGGYFDMTTPMMLQSSLVPNPTFPGPVSGVYQMLGVSYNFDVGMWLFRTTQPVRTISFDMERATANLILGGGGAAWAFYTPPVPEPSSVALLCCGMIVCGYNLRRGRWC